VAPDGDKVRGQAEARVREDPEKAAGTGNDEKVTPHERG